MDVDVKNRGRERGCDMGGCCVVWWMLRLKSHAMAHTGSSRSFFARSASLSSFRLEHSRSPLWWPHSPQREQRTLRSSTPNGR